jgi:hypothetical protein
MPPKSPFAELRGYPHKERPATRRGPAILVTRSCVRPWWTLGIEEEREVSRRTLLDARGHGCPQFCLDAPAPRDRCSRANGPADALAFGRARTVRRRIRSSGVSPTKIQSVRIPAWPSTSRRRKWSVPVRVSVKSEVTRCSLRVLLYGRIARRIKNTILWHRYAARRLQLHRRIYLFADTDNPALASAHFPYDFRPFPLIFYRNEITVNIYTRYHCRGGWDVISSGADCPARTA